MRKTKKINIYYMKGILYPIFLAEKALSSSKTKNIQVRFTKEKWKDLGKLFGIAGNSMKVTLWTINIMVMANFLTKKIKNTKVIIVLV